MRIFGKEPLSEIMRWIEQQRLAAGEVSLVVLDPDRARGLYAGQSLVIDGHTLIHRHYRLWIELASRMGLRMLTPQRVQPHLVRLRFESLRVADDAHLAEDPRERYGIDSEFHRISKLEDPTFVLDLADALARVPLGPGARVLDLGVNCGDEFELLAQLAPDLAPSFDYVGIDHSSSALRVAADRFCGSQYRFVEADINDLERLDIGTFDLIIAIGTLHSPGIADRELLRHIVHQRLRKGGGLIFGFPNCRYHDGEILFGARMRNFRSPELSLLIKDLAFYRRYLHQHKRRVVITGNHYLLLTAT